MVYSNYCPGKTGQPGSARGKFRNNLHAFRRYLPGARSHDQDRFLNLLVVISYLIAGFITFIVEVSDQSETFFCCLPRRLRNEVIWREYAANLQRFEPKLRRFGTKLRDYGTKLRDYGTKLRDYGTKLRDYGTKLRDYGTKLRDYGTKLRDYGTKLRHYATKLREFGLMLSVPPEVLTRQFLRANLYKTKRAG
jgi:hypothetical protein